jgi:hypothetical protein
MVVLALTRGGYDELRERTGAVPSPLWVGCGVLTEPELAQLRSSGIEVTKFNHPISPDDTSAIEGAIETIAQHHPGQTIWVERKP